MNRIISLLILIAPSMLFALTPKSGEQTCSRLNPDAYKLACYQTIERAHIDRWASGACDRFTSSKLTLSCMRAIRNGRYYQPVVAECDRYKNSSATIQCLNAGKNAWFNKYAIRACGRINNTTWTTSCLNSIRNCRSLSSDQIRRCDGMTSASGTVECFNYYCR